MLSDVVVCDDVCVFVMLRDVCDVCDGVRCDVFVLWV